MRPQAPRAVLAAVLTLTLTAGVIVLLTSAGPPSAGAGDFQILVGGLGFGPALDLATCPNSFDPRLGSHCPADYGLVPGGGCFCPQHAGSVFDYPPRGAAP